MTTPTSTWSDRTLVALANLSDRDDVGVIEVLEEVAIRFAHRFAPADRDYEGTTQYPRWHGAVRDAIALLRADGLVAPQDALTLTQAGRVAAEAARGRLDAQATVAAVPPTTTGRDRQFVIPGVIAAPLRNPEARGQIGFTTEEDEPVPVMAELNLQYGSSTSAAFDRAESLWSRVTDGGHPPTRIAGQYLAGDLTMQQIECLVAADAVRVRWANRSIFRVWPDFPVQQHVDASCITTNVDAGRRTYEAYGDGIVWAVIDSGISGDHPHFEAHQTLSHESVHGLHRAFPVNGQPTAEDALVDTDGHGTHVAGIIAGAIAPWLDEQPGRTVYATESRYNVENPTQPLRAPRTVQKPEKLAGMAPRARLVSLKVLGGGGTPDNRVHRVIQALSYVRQVNGDSIDGIRIHGVNLSVGYEFDPQWFACGRSPLCQEVDKLVNAGVVVVVAAGNSGYGTATVKMDAPAKFGLGMTINDPGNSALAITVGSTHRSAPDTYGVSYFSSKGPTGDGRNKPDLVAPGERITSCAAGRNLAAAVGATAPPDTAVYVEDTGTSMAAPHVSGAAAALLSYRREYVGRPDRVKETLVATAADLHRGRDFQGSGLLDLMAALGAV
jgi:subtilisin family serine protease